MPRSRPRESDGDAGTKAHPLPVLGQSKPADSFGAASALAVIFIWVYYAGMILLFGAEFTQAWVTERRHAVRPADGAVRVVEKEVRVRGGPRRQTRWRRS